MSQKTTHSISSMQLIISVATCLPIFFAFTVFLKFNINFFPDSENLIKLFVTFITSILSNV